MSLPTADPAGLLRYRTYQARDSQVLSYGVAGLENAPCIVLCHGLAANGLQFAEDAAHFAQAGFRVLVPDLRGHGRSVASSIQAEDFSIANLASDMAAMLDHADAGPVHWVGNSLGGIVALDLVGREPQRFRSLSLFGTCFALNLPAVAAPVFPLLYATLGRRLVSRLAALGTTRYRPARPLLAAMAQTFDPQVGAAIARHVRRYDLTRNALGFSGPMLILVGGRDIAVNLSLRPALRRLAPLANWAVVELPEGGHCANLDASYAWRTALTEFWGGQPS